MDPRCIADRGLPAYDPMRPAPLLHSPDQLDDWFRLAGKLYWQGVHSVYVPSLLARFGGVLALAALDAESIRNSSLDVSWGFGTRNWGRESKEIDSRWSIREQAMRSTIAAGSTAEVAIRQYFAHAADTDPEDIDTLERLTTTYASRSGDRWGWQDELESTKERTSRLLNAPTDTPVGYTVVAAATVFAPPETPGEVDSRLALAAAIDNVLTPLAGTLGARGMGSADFVAGAGQAGPDITTEQTPLRRPPPDPAVPDTLDVRGSAEAGGFAVAPVSDAERGLVVDEPVPSVRSRPTVSATPVGAELRPGEMPAPVAGVRIVNGAPVFDDPFLGILFSPGPTVASLMPPFDTEYVIEKANDLVARATGQPAPSTVKMPVSMRKQRGYDNSKLSPTWREGLHDHWQKRNLARQLADGSWEMYDMARKQWYPQKLIDMGHIMAAVEHDLLMRKQLAADMARDPVATDRKRLGFVYTFMHDQTNYLPEHQSENRGKGARSPYGYDDDAAAFDYGLTGRIPKPAGSP